MKDEVGVKISCDVEDGKIKIYYPGGMWEIPCHEDKTNVWGNKEIGYYLSHVEIVSLIKVLLQASGLKDLLDISNSIIGLAKHLEGGYE